MSRHFCTFADKSSVSEMDDKLVTLVIIWFLAVVAFFVLWAVLLKVIKRISERKNKDDVACGDADQSEIKPGQHN